MFLLTLKLIKYISIFSCPYYQVTKKAKEKREISSIIDLGFQWCDKTTKPPVKKQNVTSYETKDAGRPSFWHLHLKQFPVRDCFPVIPHISSLLLNPIELDIYKPSLSYSVTSRLATENTALFIHSPRTQCLQDKA